MELIKNEVEFNKSFSLYQSFQPASLSDEILPPEKADNQDFYNDFPGNLIQKPQYTSCRFHESKFNSSNGAYSKLHNCNFYDCLFTNCD